MDLLKIIVLFLVCATSIAVPNRYVDKDEQQLVDHILLSTRRLHEKGSLPDRKLEDELESERMPDVNPEVLKKAHQTQSSKEFQLIKKAALAVVKRLSMPSPPKADILIDKAVQFVFKESLPGEYAKIRSGVKEQVDKLMFSNGNKNSDPKIPGLREEKILTAVEDILSELAVKLNLTTLQIKFLVNSTVNVLAKEFGIDQLRKQGLHERITSHVRDKLKYEDLDNKDGRLRKLEEIIEQDILHLKLTSKQAMRLEALFVEAEALKEGLSKSERLRMLKRVIADIKDDFKTEELESKSAPPKLSSVDVKAINTIIRQKALEMQLTKKELKVLGVAILSAIEDLSMHTSPTPIIKRTQPTRVSVVPKTSKPKPTKIDDLEQELEEHAKQTKPPSTEHIPATEHTEHTKAESHAPTQKPTSVDELEEELGGTVRPSHLPSHSEPLKSSPHTEHHTLVTDKVAVSTGAVRSTKKDAEDDLIVKLAQDEADLEEQEFHTKPKTESKDELELEKNKVTHFATEPTSKKAKPTTGTKTELKSSQPIHVTKKPTEKVVPTAKVTEPTAARKTQRSTKEAHRPMVKPTKDTLKEEDEDLLQGHATNPSHGHVHVTHHPTEKVLKTTQRPTEVRIGTKHSISPTEDKEIEEDLLMGRTTLPKHQTQHVIEKQTPTEKPTEKTATTRKRHAFTEHSGHGEVTKKPKIHEELHQKRSSKDTHSRRNRVQFLDDDEDKDLLSKKNKLKDDASLENDLRLLEDIQKSKSLEDQLNEILSPENNKKDESLEDELNDLKVG